MPKVDIDSDEFKRAVFEFIEDNLTADIETEKGMYGESDTTTIVINLYNPITEKSIKINPY